MTAPRSRPARQGAAITGAVALTAPAMLLRLGGSPPGEVTGALIFGVAVVGAAFLLAWAAEALQLDVSRGLALAVLALIAVLPEYAVDFTFTYKAGSQPHRFAPLALANMTGGNRLLIGVGWAVVVLIAAHRIHSIARRSDHAGPVDTDVHLDRPAAVEIVFLAMATLYSLTLPLKHRLTIFDAAILVALYLAYVVRISRAPAGTPDLVGPAQMLGLLAPRKRRVATGAMLGYAALVIFLSAEPFAVSLVQSGRTLGISTFLLVQWLAPLASEAPELIVAGLFAWRLNTNAGLGTLVSSKVNQWTLLVGTLPIVFVVAGGAGRGLPLDALQREELFLTAAQSAFAVAVLASRSISVREAFALFGLFVSQFVVGALLPPGIRHWERIGVGIIYLVLATAMLVVQRRSLRALVRDGLFVPVADLVHGDSPAPSDALPLA